MTSYYILLWALGLPFGFCCIATINSEEATGGPVEGPIKTSTTLGFTTTTAITTTTTTPVCLPGWVYLAFTMKCYLAVSLPTLQITQGDAELQCQTYGGHLASIHSIEENNFIYSLFSSPADPIILGLFRTGPAVTDFEWYDGTPFDYNNWSNHPPNLQPDGAFGVQDCVSMLVVQFLYPNGDVHSEPTEWNDNPCVYDQRYYVCQLPRL